MYSISGEDFANKYAKGLFWESVNNWHLKPADHSMKDTSDKSSSTSATDNQPGKYLIQTIPMAN